MMSWTGSTHHLSDSTTEIFGYDAGSRLTGYTDNQSRARTLSYDTANQLTQISYSDSTA